MRIHRAAVVTVAGLALTAGTVLSGTAPVGAGEAPQVSGSVACDNTTGEQIITWTFQPSIQGDALVTSTALDSSALTAGSITSGAVTLAPSTVTAGGTATAQSVASIDAVGNVTLTVNWFNAPAELADDTAGTVTLLGQCEAAPTTAPVDTTVPVETTAVVDTASTTTTTGLLGSGGTRIPSTGRDTTLAWLGAGFVALGGTLLVIRRRSFGAR